MLKDLAALPTNVGLTLWDALPVYLSVAVAFGLLTRVWLPSAAYTWYWTRRRLLDPTGLVYLALFARELAPVYVVCMLIGIMVSATVTGKARGVATRLARRIPMLGSRRSAPPPTPVGAARESFGEAFVSALAGAGVAGLINMFGHYLPAGAGWHIVPAAGAAFVGLPPGSAAIPAVAGGSVSGSWLVAALWVAFAATFATIGLTCKRVEADPSLQAAADATSHTAPDTQLPAPPPPHEQ